MPNKKYNILFIKEEDSLLDSDTQIFDELFNKVDKTIDKEEALKLFDTNEYDMVVGDITVDPEGIVLLKTIKGKKSEQTVFALLSPKDEDKLYQIANYDINAFELLPEQFEQALGALAEFDPYQKR